VDPDLSEFNADDLTLRIAELSVSLARLNQSELHVAHAWELSGKDQDTIQSELPGEKKEALLRRNEAIHTEAVERLMGRFSLDGIRFHMHVLRGDPEYLLPKIVEQNDINLLVMGTVARTGVQGFFIGNTAEIVLRQVECAVLALKPDGFVTPIALDD
jgi:nucleotide-binding universal stress UspA family protein